MAVFRYNETIKLKKNVEVFLEITHPTVGTASHTIIDIPGDNDMETTNEKKMLLGKGDFLLSERTIIYTKAINMDENNQNVQVHYSINNKTIIEHINPKSIDPSPQIKINLKFIEL